MRLKLLVWVLLAATALCILIVSCLGPPGVRPGVREEVKACIPPMRPVRVMHRRTDIDWPTAECRNRAEALLAKMSLADKVGQMVQPDRLQLRNDLDVSTYNIGSVLNGGTSDPVSGNDPMSWARIVAQMHAISPESKHKIPVLYGIDAVHGNNNVLSTVVFPHNVGLGCTRNPALVEQVGRAAAEEIAAVGFDWTFAPVLAAARDERWGRTYEAFGETPELAAELGAAMVRGLQGERLGQGNPSVLACAKHFAADGGTTNGLDQGNAAGDMAAIKKIHVNQFKAAIEAGVGSMMASFSSVNGVKMHCHGPLLTDTLKQEMGFNGFMVSDWEAVQRLPGSSREQVADAVNGGIDMLMAPPSYQGVITALENMVPDEIPAERIDDAVGRILSVKCELGMLKPGYFHQDSAGGVFLNEGLLGKVGSKEHREVARQAVRESLVLLKNDHNLLPLKKELPRIHVAGKSADDLGNQCGGWTISWQGSSGDITTGTTVLKAIRQMVSPTGQGTQVTYSLGGERAEGASVAIAVIGESPYAEGNGDRESLELDPEDIAVVERLKKAGVPVVVILMSGRPMILGTALDQADAVIAAWLPGTEGMGIADVLFGDVAPTGKLSHSWPKRMDQIPINVGDASYDPLFPYGFGLTYGAKAPTGTSPEPETAPPEPPPSESTAIPSEPEDAPPEPATVPPDPAAQTP